jgi:hypothetical protein
VKIRDVEKLLTSHAALVEAARLVLESHPGDSRAMAKANLAFALIEARKVREQIGRAL